MLRPSNSYQVTVLTIWEQDAKSFSERILPQSALLPGTSKPKFAKLLIWENLRMGVPPGYPRGEVNAVIKFNQLSKWQLSGAEKHLR